MAVLDLVEWAEGSPGEMVRRVPEAGSGEFRLGSQLVVREHQVAVFYHNGRAQDTFGPGRYTLSTENIPLLAALFGLPFGGQSPFRTEVYFVSRRTFLDLRWGTPQPIALRDPDLGMVRLRAFGTFALEVEDAPLFVTKIVGGQGLYGTSEIGGYLRDIIASRLADLLGELHVGLFDLPAKYDEVSAALASTLREEFQAMGLLLKSLFVTSISTTEQTQKAIDERAAMGAIGNMDAYLKFKAAQALEPGAAGGGAAGSAAAAGLGLGAGVGLGTLMAQMMSQASRPAGAEAAPGVSSAAPAELTLGDVFDGLNRLVEQQLSLPAEERSELVAALEGLRQELAAAAPDLDHVRDRRAAITQRWPWVAPALDVAFQQPPVAAALARAASSYTSS